MKLVKYSCIQTHSQPDRHLFLPDNQHSMYLPSPIHYLYTKALKDLSLPNSNLNATYRYKQSDILVLAKKKPQFHVQALSKKKNNP